MYGAIHPKASLNRLSKPLARTAYMMRRQASFLRLIVHHSPSWLLASLPNREAVPEGPDFAGVQAAPQYLGLLQKSQYRATVKVVLLCYPGPTPVSFFHFHQRWDEVECFLFSEVNIGMSQPKKIVNVRRNRIVLSHKSINTFTPNSNKNTGKYWLLINTGSVIGFWM